MDLVNGRQFRNVTGEMLGRLEYGSPNSGYNSYLFQVRLDDKGCDDGGAYHGHGLPLFCLRNRDCQHFVRAENRKAALKYFKEQWPNLVLRKQDQQDRLKKSPKSSVRSRTGYTEHRGDRTIHRMF